MVKLSDYDVIVFDLDDTLYSEKLYVESGFNYLSSLISQLFQVDIKDDLVEAFRRKEKDVLGHVFGKFNLPVSIKEHFILAYRYHYPDIYLHRNVRFILDSLVEKNKPIYLITDGRSLTQRLKINALGIKHYFKTIYVSEEVGVEKPDPQSFLDVQHKEPNSKIVYIADNPIKDFIAPKKLGWASIGVRNEKTRVHPIIDGSQDKPDIWLQTFEDINI